MAKITVKAEQRTADGGRGLAAEREAGRVPAVLYKGGTEPLPLILSARDMDRVILADGPHAELTLEIAGAGNRDVRIQEIQRGALSRQLIHLDFLALGD
ncbi:MAG TPA: hypothetical protein DCZ72_14115 [Armatimonadetes bacterium]|nr:hypothetical protein [Armatimonadota bacterium]